MLLGLAGIAAPWLAAAGEITLQLRNGDRLTGELLSESDGRIRLRHPVLGVMRVPSADVTNRITAPVIAATSPPSAAAPGKASPPGGTPVGKPAGTASTPTKPAPRRWVFDVQAGVDLGFSATDRQLYNARAHVTYAKDRLRNSIDTLFTYGRAAGIKSADRVDGLMKTDYEIGGRYFIYDLGGVGRDSIRLIDLRYEIGPGIGYHVIRMDRFKLNAELGANYQVNYFSDDTEKESFFYRVAEDAIWQATPKLAFDQRFEFFPGITDIGKYRLRFEGNMRYSLRSNLYFNLTVLDLYDNDPAHGVSRNDLQLRSSVGVKF